jgi:hypothetical protein
MSSAKKKRTVTAEIQTPKRQADFPFDVAMPRVCDDRSAAILGEGLTKPERITDGRIKYARLRQFLLDSQARTVATNRHV